ncbi:hypothetical protein K435DRAFT_743911 [Dendrothele bispora CBS 962.96]|uniref:F-box domain-containing protein n=1 Tax=Dendrothele bispora (strain CBS 962.96) TaxID=1314807 RepID=A0A4S8MSM7_DENBC|nr:hypothetical protein K435DRAFT_743911 [Dendrothele bispora CBS 962.96]
MYTSLPLLPLDLLHPILCYLTDNADINACSQVNRTFNFVAIPILYHTLDSRVISKFFIHHPSVALKSNPALALHVRCVTETSAIQNGLLSRYPFIVQNTLSALALCSNIQSLTWIDNWTTPNDMLSALLSVVRNLPLQELTIRTHNYIGEGTWTELSKNTGLRKLSLWSMSGPKVLHNWSNNLCKTLVQLELGLTCFSLETCLHFLSQCPLLTDLRLKGAPSTSITSILSHLPNLKNLDTEYTLLPSSSSLFRRAQSAPVHGQSAHNKNVSLLPILQTLTVRTTALDALGPQKLWTWVHNLVPRRGLQKLKLHSFTLYGCGNMTPSSSSSSLSLPWSGPAAAGTVRLHPGEVQTQTQTMFPKMFMLELAVAQRDTLKCCDIEGLVLNMSDLETVLGLFPKLEVLKCAIACKDVASLLEVFSRVGQELRKLRLVQVQWWTLGSRFTAEDAKRMMLNSNLRVIQVGSILYTGRCVRDLTGAPTLEVSETVQMNRW